MRESTRATVPLQEATALQPLVESFVYQYVTGGYSAATVAIYRYWLGRLAAQVPDLEAFDSLATSRFITGLRQRGLKHSTIHQAYRTVKTFVMYLKSKESEKHNGPLPHDPLADVKVKVPQVLYDPPKPEEVQAVLDLCDKRTLVGARNRALVLTMAGSGLRRAEVIHLLVDHWNRGDRESMPSLIVRGGKGMKDRPCAVDPLTARAIRDYLSLRGPYDRTDYLFVTDDGRPMKGRSLVQILHRLSKRAGLPKERWLHPHAIRHLAGTSWARSGMGFDQIRRQLGHASMDTTMKYVPHRDRRHGGAPSGVGPGAHGHTLK